MAEKRKAASIPSQACDCHIRNHSPPTAMKQVNQRTRPRVRPATAGPFAALNRCAAVLRLAKSRAEPQRHNADTTSSMATISQNTVWCEWSS